MDPNLEIKLNSNYMKAVQDLRGETLSEKKKTVTGIVNEVAEHFRSSTMTHSDLTTYITEVVSEGLIPLVTIEVSRKLRWSEGVTKALLSTDKFIFSRALKAKWYFDGTCKNTVEPEFYDTEIFPFVSYINRLKIIKTLSIFLSDTDISEKLYNYICEKYSRNQALALLSACKVEFILDKLQKNFFVIPVNIYDSIHRKHPLLLVDYIKMLSKQSKPIRAYVQFWIKYLPKNLSAFTELKNYFQTGHGFKLSSRKITFLLKNAQEGIIEDHYFFLKIKGFENVEKYLSSENIRKLIKNGIQKKNDGFNLYRLLDLLKIFSDKKKYLNIIRSAYKEVHNLDFLEIKGNNFINIVLNLHNYERYAIAEKEFLLEPKWCTSKYLEKFESRWVCLLPIKESIPIIKEKLQKSNEPIDRYLLWKLIVRTCKINEDRRALVDFLTFFNQRYVNDQTILVFNLLVYISQEFVFDKLLCKEIESLLRTLYHRNAFSMNVASRGKYTSKKHRNIDLCKLELTKIQALFDKVLECKINDNCEDTDEFIKMYCRVYIDFNEHCNFFKSIREIKTKKICLALVLKQFQSLVSEDIEIPKNVLYRICYDLLNVVNQINKEKLNKENFDIREYPWIIDKLKIIINDSSYNEFPNIVTFTKSIYQELPELYQIKDLVKIETFTSSITPLLLRFLKKDLKGSLSCIDNILNILISIIDTDKFIRHYINSSLWFNKFSLILSDKLLKKLKIDNKGNIFKCLALMCDKLDLEEIVKNISPEKYNESVTDDKKRELIIFYKNVLKGLNMSNDLVHFKYVENMCQEEYFIEVINHIKIFALRCPVSQVASFAMRLINDRVSLRKQGLAIFYKIESFPEIILINNKILGGEANNTIRSLIYKSVLNLFIDHKTQETWSILFDSLEGLKMDDEVWDLFLDIGRISEEYRSQYILGILKTIKRIESSNISESKIFFENNVSKILEFISSQSDSFNEEVHSFIFENYYKSFTRLYFMKKKYQIGYLFKKYLGSAEESFDKRLENVIELFFGDEDIKRSQGPIFDSKICVLEIYMKQLFYYGKIIPPIKYKRIFNEFKRSYISKFSPMMNPKLYIMLSIFDMNNLNLSTKEISDIIKKELPRLIKIFGSSLTVEIANIFKDNFRSCYDFNYTEHIDRELELVDILLDENDEDLVLFVSHIARAKIKLLYLDKEKEKKILQKMSRHSNNTVLVYYNLIVKKLID
jgi:hypothetical protein